MRHCSGENPDVYEDQGSDLAALLRRVASQIEQVDGYPTVNVFPYIDDEGFPTYLAHLYVS
jgi:hypothetical protein